MELSRNKFAFYILMAVVVVLLNPYTLRLPLINQLLGFFLAGFLPGFLFLKINGFKEMDVIDRMLYSLGISIFFIMFIGLLINTTFPLLGFRKPLHAITPLLILSILLLLALSYRSLDKERFLESRDGLITPQNIFLLLLPFIIIISTYIRNISGNGSLIIITILLISLIPVFVAFNKIPRESYPLAVFAVSISLLFHLSLISNYIFGWDIQREYYLTSLVINNGYWNSTTSDAYNGMLSVVILAPVLSIFCKINPIWIFKVIYPVIFSFVPLALYQFFKKQVDERIAFFAVFFFMSLFVFYTEMLALARQQIAELFLALILLVMADKKIKGMHKSLLFVIFSFSLVVSHYGLSYIFMLMLFLSFLLVLIIYSPRFINRIKATSKRLKINPHLFDEQYTRGNIIRYSFEAIFLTFALEWYMYVSD